MLAARPLNTNKTKQPTDPAEVLESKPDASAAAAAANKKGGGGGGGGLVYYVHFLDCDKRLDEWVTPDRLSLAPPSGAKSKLEAAPSLALQAG